MRYLLDASSIYKLAELNQLDFIMDSVTTDLARYELGNSVLKDCVIHKRLDAEKAQQLVKFLYGILDDMDKVIVVDCEGTLKTALEFKLSFYDAAYVQYAKATNLTLVTEDEKLTKKVKEHIKIINAEGLLK